jgi:hypothetical protein
VVALVFSFHFADIATCVPVFCALNVGKKEILRILLNVVFSIATKQCFRLLQHVTGKIRHTLNPFLIFTGFILYQR